jgi:hypothetical protein
MIMAKTITVSSVVTAIILMSCAAAQAIECDRQFQVVDGQRLATPYCADQYLGQVARDRGLKVTDGDLRQSSGAKTDVCRQIGMDDRVRTICTNYFPYPGSND